MDHSEGLETGCGPGTPPGDNASNDYAQGLAAGYLALSRARGEAVLDDGLLAAGDAGSPSAFGNIAVVRRPLDEPGWGAAAQQLAAFYGGRPGGDYLVFSPWPTPDLRPAGLTLAGHPPLMLRAPAPLAAPAPEGVEVRAVRDEAGAADWERTLVDGFPLTELQPCRAGCVLPPVALEAPGWRHWVAYLDDRPVACASAHVVPGRHVDVEFVATVAAARGRGIGGAVTAAATLADPGLPAMLLASDPGRPVYERLGYRAVVRYTLWIGHR